MIGAAAALAAASAALPATYPTALDRDSIAAWLPQAAGLAADQVIAVTASSAVAIVSRATGPDGRIAVLLRALPLTPEATARGGVLAWQMRLDVDCRTGAVRLGGTTGYDTQLAEGEGAPLAPADAAWRPPKPGTPLESARRAVCEPDFQPPLLAAGQRLAKAAPAPVRTAKPAPATPPPALASLRPALPAPFFARVSTVPTTPSRSGRGALQVVSSSSASDTRQALATLQVRFPQLQALQTRIEPAQVGGRTVYRGVIAGFSSPDQARMFCEMLKRGGRGCLLR